PLLRSARINTTRAKTAGQEKRPRICGFVIGRWTLNVTRLLQMPPKKYRPPRPMGVKGGCSPQNNLPKSAELVTELYPCRNKNFLKIILHFFACPGKCQKLHHDDVGSNLMIARRPSWISLTPLAESWDARFSFVCGICVPENREILPDRFW